jgi:hypothetical protein
MNKVVGLGIAGLLIVAGVLLMALDLGEIEPECADPGTPSSGFVDEDNPDCAITIESYEEIVDAETGPQWDNIAGLILVLGGLGIGVATFVVGRGKDEATGDPGTPAA